MKKRDIKLLLGRANIHTKINRAPYLLADVNLNSKQVTVELPRLYYLGYKITLKDVEGKIHNLDYKEDKYGFIKTEIPKSGELEVKYKGTSINRISLIVVFISTLGFVVFINKKIYRWGVVWKK